jgi:hypothetical protein
VLRLAMQKIDTAQFFEKTLPGMIELALALPVLVPDGLPLLRATFSRSLTLTRRQNSCLLACAFFGLFPQRNRSQKLELPSINFGTLFAGEGNCPLCVSALASTARAADTEMAVIEALCSPSTGDCQPSRHPRRLNQLTPPPG